VLENPKHGLLLGALVLPPELELRAGIVSAFEQMVNQGISFARRMQSSQALALREMCAPVISKSAAHRIESTLVSSYRATSPIRDADALSGLVDELDAGDAQHQLDALRSGLTAWRLSRYDDRKIASALLTGIVNLRGLPAVLDGALAGSVDWNHLVEGVRLTFRSAKEHYQRARSVPDPAHILGLRKRTRDLRFQLELIASTGRAAPRLRRKVTRLEQPLSRAVHLQSLRSHAHRLLPAADAEHLASALDRLVRKNTSKAMRRAEKVYGSKASRFADKLRG